MEHYLLDKFSIGHTNNIVNSKNETENSKNETKMQKNIRKN